MTVTIDIARRDGGDPETLCFDVVVRDAAGKSRHRVTMSRARAEKLGGGVSSAEQCLDAAFRFLLDKEPKEQILARFDVSVISLYFPEFESELGKYLG